MMHSLFKVARNYGTNIYSRFKITRGHDQSVAVFMNGEATVNDLISQIKLNFPVNDNLILTGSEFMPSMLGSAVPVEAQKGTEQMGNELLMSLLLHGDLFLYESQNKVVVRCYGIECEDINITNNRNLPERITSAIMELAYEWENVKSLGEAISPSFVDTTDPLIVEEINETKQSLQKSHSLLTHLEKFKPEPYVGNPVNIFIFRMMAIMSLNWGFLFAVTYAKYGWDVGEPLSYLTSIGVDLMALLGWFNMEERLQQWMEMQKYNWQGVLNIEQQKKYLRWHVSYCRRVLY